MPRLLQEPFLSPTVNRMLRRSPKFLNQHMGMKCVQVIGLNCNNILHRNVYWHGGNVDEYFMWAKQCIVILR
jgi:hypothetical protein